MDLNTCGIIKSRSLELLELSNAASQHPEENRKMQCESLGYDYIAPLTSLGVSGVMVKRGRQGVIAFNITDRIPTKLIVDLMTHFCAIPIPFDGAWVHSGYYLSIARLRQKVCGIIESHKDVTKWDITGRSFGGACSQMLYWQIKKKRPDLEHKLGVAYTYGSTKVALSHYDEIRFKNIICENDPVWKKLPGYVLIGDVVHFSKDNTITEVPKYHRRWPGFWDNINIIKLLFKRFKGHSYQRYRQAIEADTQSL